MKDILTSKSHSSDKKKKGKKHRKRYDSSSSNSESCDSEKQWVEALPPEKRSKISKKKKKKHKKKYKSSSSDSESASGEQMWTEALTSSTKARNKTELSANDAHEIESPSETVVANQRESWMTEESFVTTLSKEELLPGGARQKRADNLREMREKEERVRQERELNPHLKKDRAGLPEKETDVESLNLPSTSVGDGGYSWLKKAYYRIQEQAQQESRSMEEVAVERWGSLSKLKYMIEEAEKRMMSRPNSEQNYSKKRLRNRYEEDTQRIHGERFKKPRDSHESENSTFSDRSRFQFEYKKPSKDNRHDKKLNQFKSTRPSKFYDYGESLSDNESTNSSYDLKNPKDDSPGATKRQDNRSAIRKDSSSRENRIPAWKKPTYANELSKDKKLLANYSPESSNSTTEKSVKKTGSETDRPKICSEEDLSKLAARQIKAEIMGDTSLALKLKQQLDEARKRVKEEGFDKPSCEKTEEVVLTKFGSTGQAQPIQALSDEIYEAKQKKNKYFDDSKYSLKQMFEREKLTTADDQMEMFVEAASKYDETSEIDFEIGNTSKKISQTMSSGRQEEKDIVKAMNQHKKFTEQLEKCRYCLCHVEKYLVVDQGKEVYVCLPKYKPLTEGHCLIVPMSHVSSFLSLDEDVWREVEDYKNMLRNLFRPQNKCVIFMETSMNFQRYPHAILECIPVPEEDADMAPFYFKKAIQESEAEWAHNKKLIDLRSKDLRHSVPKNLPYFHVEFDPKVHPGFAHVIEEEKRFPPNFGKEIIGGILSIDYNHLYKNRKEDFTPEKFKEVNEFKKMWCKFRNETS